MKEVLKKFFWCFNNFNYYKLIALLGLMLRVIFLPNWIPSIFEVLANFFITQLNFQPWLYEVLLRIALTIVDFLALNSIYYYFTYWSVGAFYEKGSSPIFGSISYTILYVVHMAVPLVLIQNFVWLAIILILVLYAILIGVFCFISYKLEALSKKWPFGLILYIVSYILISVAIIILKIKFF